jgi:hypothetical protein
MRNPLEPLADDARVQTHGIRSLTFTVPESLAVCAPPWVHVEAQALGKDFSEPLPAALTYFHSL